MKFSNPRNALVTNHGTTPFARRCCALEKKPVHCNYDDNADATRTESPANPSAIGHHEPTTSLLNLRDRNVVVRRFTCYSYGESSLDDHRMFINLCFVDRTFDLTFLARCARRKCPRIRENFFRQVWGICRG